MSGNIGLITIHYLMGEISELDASMAKLVNTDGLIIDVRECPGGSDEISTQLSSFFMSEGEELMSLYTRGVPASYVDHRHKLAKTVFVQSTAIAAPNQCSYVSLCPVQPNR
jgi:C-terminal processing protease CtpA/Prc